MEGVLAGLFAFGMGQMLITILIVNVLRFHAARKSLRPSPSITDRASAPAKTVDTPSTRHAKPMNDELLVSSSELR